jgi:hypothetical protein|tara:strand:+ start:778 stop:1083 length:306 start_codon:yes stop_codon:yes gene_type:complete
MYKYWTWTKTNEKMDKSNKKNKIKEICERIRDDQFDNLKERNSEETKKNNKEISAKRLMDRDQIKQRTFNPFLCNNNYLSDLNIQESFLRSKNSSFEALEQ